MRSKWRKTEILLSHRSIRRYIPETCKFSRENLSSMLNQYSMVYVKPEQGTYGRGVMRVQGERGKGYSYQYEETLKQFENIDSLYKSLSKRIQGRSYLIQRGIHLLKHKTRRFDIRVMVQLSPAGKWENTGVIGRLGHPRKIVTNYHSGGKPTAIETLLKGHVTGQQQTRLLKDMGELGVEIASHMQKKYSKLKHIGVDIGLDRTLTPWIIEVNMNPDPYIFNQLKDKSMYRKVMKYRRAALQKSK
ncbi:ATP-binding protein [Paenibacillus sp. CAA11]|uniref:YheC/YheD family protein n=1 Tax=Paenibacillus sp. CAA11 TaxID=1532905 RepID=UPI000D3CAC92|nr:YheC/YheD family protein [Paenibacillus sp. CAA11]AWB44547.1 ATP-binding protein [Paenibacillus sp. CAA11]